MSLYRLLPVVMGLAVGLLLTYPLLVLGVRWQWWDYQTGFSLLAGVALTGVILLASAGIALIIAIRNSNGWAMKRGMVAVILLAIPIAYLTFFGIKASQLPMIHDISTDKTNPPHFMALAELRPDDANALDYNSEIAQLQAEFYPEIDSLVLPLPSVKVLELAQQAAQDLKWKVVLFQPSFGHMEATDSTLLFGFVDDIVVRVSEHKEGSVVDVRSVSRVGKSDLGKNAQRIVEFQQRLLHLSR